MVLRLMSFTETPVFFQFLSHKMARLAVPYFCALALLSSALVPGPAFAVIFWLQVGFYVAGFLAQTPLGKAPVGRFLRVSWTFMILNAAAVVGLWVFATGRDQAVWTKT